MILRRRIHPAWLAAVPAVYVILAIPVLVAGRSLGSVISVYADQANTFDRLFISAANIWMFAASVPYPIGVAIGVVLATLAGLALSIFVTRSRRADPEFILLVACASLMLMPYLLPKMHERYFYGFELASIALACINPRYLPFAVIAQIDGVLAYLAFDRGMVMGQPPAALCNTFLAFYLVLDLWRGERGFRSPKLAWFGFIVTVAGLLSYLASAGSGWNMTPTYLLATGLALAMTLRLLKESQRSPIDGPEESRPTLG
jgi:Gpi18-like mannosyltransferase